MKWVGRSKSAATWEPASSCRLLVKAFENNPDGEDDDEDEEEEEQEVGEEEDEEVEAIIDARGSGDRREYLLKVCRGTAAFSAALPAAAAFLC